MNRKAIVYDEETKTQNEKKKVIQIISSLIMNDDIWTRRNSMKENLWTELN